MKSKKLEGKKILIADDDYICSVYIQEILEETGAYFHWVNNGLNAVEYIKLNPEVDLIFMDLLMPIMGGKEAIEQIQLINNKIPIIIQSGSVHEDILAKNLITNFNFLEKPFNPNELLFLIKKIFDK